MIIYAEYVILILHTLDYLLFFFISENRLLYVFSFQSICSYITIIPTFLVRGQIVVDPARIEQALRLLERQLDNGEIPEEAFEAEESRLLEELMEMRAIQAGTAAEEPADAA